MIIINIFSFMCLYFYYKFFIHVSFLRPTAIKNNGEEEDLSFKLIALLLADNKLNEASIKLHNILKKDKKTIAKLFEIYPQAKDIQEIVDIIAQYKD